MNLKLQDKVVLITGATGTIGQDLCKGFAREEAFLVPIYRNEKKFNDLLKNLNYKKILPIRIENFSEKEITELIKRIYKKTKKIDILINAIGYVSEMPFALTDDKFWNEHIETNLNITVRFCNAILKYFVRQKSGNIINLASVTGFSFGSGIIPYAVSKAGIIRFTQVLAKEYGIKNIRVNSVSPGFINSPMTDKIKEKFGEEILSRTPLNKFGSTEDVVNAVLFLASDYVSGFISGHNLIVDGGLTL